MTFVDVREPHTGKLLFKFDPARLLIEIQQRGIKTVIDLTQYETPQAFIDRLNENAARSYEAAVSAGLLVDLTQYEAPESAKESDGERPGTNIPNSI